MKLQLQCCLLEIAGIYIILRRRVHGTSRSTFLWLVQLDWILRLWTSHQCRDFDDLGSMFLNGNLQSVWAVGVTSRKRMKVISKGPQRVWKIVSTQLQLRWDHCLHWMLELSTCSPCSSSVISYVFFTSNNLESDPWSQTFASKIGCENRYDRGTSMLGVLVPNGLSMKDWRRERFQRSSTMC